MPTHTPGPTVLSHGHLFSECLEHQASLGCIRTAPPTGRFCPVSWLTQRAVKPAPAHPAAPNGGCTSFAVYSLLRHTDCQYGTAAPPTSLLLEIQAILVVLRSKFGILNYADGNHSGLLILKSNSWRESSSV